MFILFLKILMRRIFYFVLFLNVLVFSQTEKPQYSLDVNYYYGSILPHSEKIKHLISAHPDGFFLSFQQKTFGDKEWQRRLNYPDLGITLHYQNNRSEARRVGK